MKRKILFLVLGIIVIAGFYFLAGKGKLSIPAKQSLQRTEVKTVEEGLINEGVRLLRDRKDDDALDLFEKILLSQPNNPDALWGKAEVLRRNREYKQAEYILNKILKENPRHTSTLNTLAYIRYKEGKFKEAVYLLNQVLGVKDLDKQNQALAYIMLGMINSGRSAKGGFISKIRYGTNIRYHFFKAEELAPELPEAHLSLGTFYLLAPKIAGGNLDKAIEELLIVVKMAPDFATANARLAQAYQKKGLIDKYEFYITRAMALDPDNEVLKEVAD